MEKIIINKNNKAIILFNEIKNLEKERDNIIDKLDKKIDLKYNKLKKICICNETEKQEEYIEGSYLNKSQYIIKIVCKVCGKILNKEIKEGYYC
jgi:hypothetical protein